MFLLKTKLDICNDRCSRDLSDLSVRGRTILGSARRAFINRASLTVPCPTHIYHPLSYSCNIPFKASSIFPRACSDISSWTRVCLLSHWKFAGFCMKSYAGDEVLFVVALFSSLASFWACIAFIGPSKGYIIRLSKPCIKQWFCKFVHSPFIKFTIALRLPLYEFLSITSVF